MGAFWRRKQRMSSVCAPAASLRPSAQSHPPALRLAHTTIRFAGANSPGRTFEIRTKIFGLPAKINISRNNLPISSVYNFFKNQRATRFTWHIRTDWEVRRLRPFLGLNINIKYFLSYSHGYSTVFLATSKTIFHNLFEFRPSLPMQIKTFAYSFRQNLNPKKALCITFQYHMGYF